MNTDSIQLRSSSRRFGWLVGFCLFVWFVFFSLFVCFCLIVLVFFLIFILLKGSLAHGF